MPDKFDELMANLANVGESERSAMTNPLREKCLCPLCPTYTECAKTNSELLFCIEGRSPSCITQAVKCICGDCPVEKDLGMKNLFYCIEGSEAEKRKRKSERLKARTKQ